MTDPTRETMFAPVPHWARTLPVGLALVAWAAARADPPPPPDEARYEARLEARALGALGRRRAESPEGRRIGRILVFSEPIIGPGDPWPRLLNAVHVTTREHVIRRELLFSEGEPYREELAFETARNLRRMAIIAVAAVVPVESDAPDSVDVVVVTKDLWSIRFNSSFNLVGDLLQYLRLRPTEANVLGLDKQLSADFELRLDTLALGGEYIDRRLLGSRLYLLTRAAVVLNRASGRAEGSRGALQLNRPLYALSSRWAFDSEASWNVRTERIFQGAQVREIPVPGGLFVPHAYEARELRAAGWGTRAWPALFRTELSAGAGGWSQNYEPPPGLSDAQREVLAAEALPRSEDAAWVGLRLRAYRAQFHVLRDVDTFALSEDRQVGPLLRAEVRVAASSPPFAEGWAMARNQFVAGDAVLSASVAGSVRRRFGGEAWVNRVAAAEVSAVSPHVGPGRFAARGAVEWRDADLDRRVLLLGGGNGLRGAPPEALDGTRWLLWNLEYRTRAVDVATLHVGGVAFWDAGAAWSPGETSALVHTVGVGLRALFPQFDIEPIRLDVGFVLGGPQPPPLDRFSASFGQVTRYRPRTLEEPFR